MSKETEKKSGHNPQQPYDVSSGSSTTPASDTEAAPLPEIINPDPA